MHLLFLVGICHAASFSQLFTMARDRAVGLFNWRSRMEQREEGLAKAHAKKMTQLPPPPQPDHYSLVRLPTLLDKLRIPFFDPATPSSSPSTTSSSPSNSSSAAAAASASLPVSASPYELPAPSGLGDRIGLHCQSLCQRYEMYSSEVDRLSEAIDEEKEPWASMRLTFSHTWKRMQLGENQIFSDAARLRERVAKEGRSRLRDACTKAGGLGLLRAIPQVNEDLGPVFHAASPAPPLSDQQHLELDERALFEVRLLMAFWLKADAFLRELQANCQMRLFLAGLDCFLGGGEWEDRLAEWLEPYRLAGGSDRLALELARETSSALVANWMGDRILVEKLPKEGAANFHSLAGSLHRTVIPALLLLLEQLRPQAASLHAQLPHLLPIMQRGLLQAHLFDNLDPSMAANEEEQSVYDAIEARITRMDVGETLLIASASQAHAWLTELTKTEARTWSALLINTGRRPPKAHGNAPKGQQKEGHLRFLPWVEYEGLSLTDLRDCRFFRDTQEPTVSPMYPTMAKRKQPDPWPALRRHYIYGQFGSTCITRSIMIWMRISLIRALGEEQGWAVYRLLKIHLNLQLTQALVRGTAMPSSLTHPLAYTMVSEHRKALNQSSVFDYKLNAGQLLEATSPWNMCITYALKRAHAIRRQMETTIGPNITRLLDESLAAIKAFPGVDRLVMARVEQIFENPNELPKAPIPFGTLTTAAPFQAANVLPSFSFQPGNFSAATFEVGPNHAGKLTRRKRITVKQE